ncbi:Polyketide synthase enoylreductase [Penicillium cataractarum]|uniref:Polyketide synthase enoylreductase n=1 Tax=Penicillium cataractarum TaxID=2100454 RepID=A0A9W9RZX3_9EURO|nr:Polyketide synthase enoylreductase [Penicillium cataractarum]KAJ5368489.1 Polyketide synthase enoylreductase [Penicillium cataractarum]
MRCGGITVYAALRKCSAKPALEFGDKKDFAEECGAESYIDLPKYSNGDPQLTTDVKRITSYGLGATAVIVCTGANSAYADSVSLVRFAGTVVYVGVPEGAPVAIASAHPAKLLSQEISIVGSVVGNRMDAIETMDMAARGVATTRVTVQPMSSLKDVFDKMNNRQLKGRIVLDLFQ